MHTNKEYRFDCEASAKEFIAQQEKLPHQDKYIRGPFFMDENEIFASMPWANNGKTWWQVNIETFS